MVGSIFFMLCAGVVARLFLLQVVDHPALAARAEERGKVESPIVALRGAIYARRIHDKNTAVSLAPIAINRDAARLFADPHLIKNPTQVAEALSPLINREPLELIPLLSKSNDSYEVLGDNLNPDTAKRITDLKLPGIAIEHRTERFYPERDDFAHVTGFLGFQGDERKGQYGVEGSFDELLAGKEGLTRGVRDVSGSIIATSDFDLDAAEDGSSVVITLDRALQKKACELLRAGLTEYKAQDAVMVVMDPKTGAILALCRAPSYDPNHYGDVRDISVYTNTALQAYEPGSVMKPVTLAAALDTKRVAPTDVFEDTGSVKVGGFTITNAAEKIFGKVTVADIIKFSINTGSVHVALATGKELFVKYINAFEFGVKAGIGLAGEQAGDIRSIKLPGDVYLATASYGQGIMVTPIQLARAFAVFANGGTLPTPYLISEIRHADGRIERPNAALPKKVVISPETASQVRQMLVTVTEEGFGKKAQVPGYYVGGKTGTALIPNPSGPGYTSQSIHTFVGFAPIKDPKFVAVVKYVAPEARFAESTAVPTFGAFARFALDYLEVPHER
ncbi:MAG: penicillin-binding protein 2 [bacterium]|nr:penicillin-binding protein 2 [bacterium]